MSELIKEYEFKVEVQ